MKKIKNWLKKSINKIRAKIDKEQARHKAKKLYPQYDEYILKLFFENYPNALSLTLLERLDSLLKEMKPKLVFEFGTGVSTVVLAKNTLYNDCKIFTVDDADLGYSEKTYRNIVKKYRANNITFICSPNGYRSFAEKMEVAINQTVDLVIIDGPAGERYSESVRSFYHKIISSKTVCVIDNTNREKENREAEDIAKSKFLTKMDFKDPIYTGYQYSILFPLDWQNSKNKIF